MYYNDLYTQNVCIHIYGVYDLSFRKESILSKPKNVTSGHFVGFFIQSQILARLAAAHRGAVRAIQAFVNSLPFTDLQRGLPASYQELALLIRQMSLLSTQLNAEDKSSVHQDLLSMLDRVDVSVL